MELTWLTTSWKEEGIELGRSQGIELGRSQGIELGRSQGMNEGKRKLVQDLVNYRFGEVEIEVQRQIESLNEVKLEALSKALFDMKQPNDLREWLTQHA